MSLKPSYGFLAQETETCLAIFDTLCQSVSSGSSYLPLEILRFSQLNDEKGRLKVWAGNIGALQRGPASLDDRLSNAPDVSEQVKNVLIDLNASLTQCKPVKEISDYRSGS
jgi:hypothetical protein